MRGKKVVKLATKKDWPYPVDKDLLETLADLTKLAKAGRIQGIAYATITSRDGGEYYSCASGWGGEGARGNVHTMAGAIQALALRFNKDKLL